jgi:hypothetical protein
MVRVAADSPWARFWHRSRPTDIVIGGYILLFAIGLVIFAPRTPSAKYLIPVHLALLAAIYLIVVHWNDRTRGIAGFIRLLYAPLLFTFLYSESRVAVHWLFPGFLDGQIVAFERYLFGVDPNVWLQAGQSPLVNEWMMLGYFAYYSLIPLLALTLFFRRRTHELNVFVTAATIVFAVSYVGFIVYPVEGPRYYLAGHFSEPLTGFVFVPLVHWVIDRAAIHGGCMPSSHVAASWVVLIWAYRTQRRMAWILTPIILTLTVATIWGRFHYFTDVLVGLPIGLGAVWLADYCWH